MRFVGLTGTSAASRSLCLSGRYDVARAMNCHTGHACAMLCQPSRVTVRASSRANSHSHQLQSSCSTRCCMHEQPAADPDCRNHVQAAVLDHSCCIPCKGRGPLSAGHSQCLFGSKWLCVLNKLSCSWKGVGHIPARSCEAQPCRKDFEILWVPPVCCACLSSRAVQGNRNALAGIDILRKVCNHPDLLQRSQWQGSEEYGSPERSGKLTVALKVGSAFYPQNI